MLSDILTAIDTLLAEKFPDLARSLQPGAKDEPLVTLRETCFEGKALPHDLETFYRWHDGQHGYQALHPYDNRTLLSIQEALEAWRFLNDPKEDILQPMMKTWLPLFYNGSGDYVVYDLVGANQGKLITYWHDDAIRKVAYSNLEAWATDTLEALYEEATAE